jgi:hypothetical protein
MKDVRLTIRKRAFPSQGRVRLNIAHLPNLGINEGQHVDVINEATKKSVTTTVIADTMVREGHIRMSEEDLKTIGLNDDDEVLVRKTPPVEEKIKKAAADTRKSLSKYKSVDKCDRTVKKTKVDVKASTAKVAYIVKKETKKASDSMATVALKPPYAMKKKVKKATGSDNKR